MVPNGAEALELETHGSAELPACLFRSHSRKLLSHELLSARPSVHRGRLGEKGMIGTEPGRPSSAWSETADTPLVCPRKVAKPDAREQASANLVIVELLSPETITSSQIPDAQSKVLAHWLLERLPDEDPEA